MLSARKIILTEPDCARLENVIYSGLAFVLRDKPYIQSLRGEIAIADVVPASEIPSDIVTMNSRVRLLFLDDGEEETYTLVYPEDANIKEGKLSVLAPIGTAILGSRVGDEVDWEVPSGTIRVRIEEILFQPERDAITSAG